MNVLPPVVIPASGLVAEVTIPSPATAVTLLNQSSFSITVSNFGGKSFYMSSGKEMTLPWNGQSGSFNVAGVSNSTAGTMLVTYYQSGDNPLPTGVVGPLVDISGQNVNVSGGTIEVLNATGTTLGVTSEQVVLLNENVQFNVGPIGYVGSTGFTVDPTVHAIAAYADISNVTNANPFSGLAANTGYGFLLSQQLSSSSAYSNPGVAPNLFNLRSYVFVATTDASGDIPAGTIWEPYLVTTDFTQQNSLDSGTSPPIPWVYTGSNTGYWSWATQAAPSYSTLPGEQPFNIPLIITGYQESVPPSNLTTVSALPAHYAYSYSLESNIKRLMPDMIAPASEDGGGSGVLTVAAGDTVQLFAISLPSYASGCIIRSITLTSEAAISGIVTLSHSNGAPFSVRSLISSNGQEHPEWVNPPGIFETVVNIYSSVDATFTYGYACTFI